LLEKALQLQEMFFGPEKSPPSQKWQSCRIDVSGTDSNNNGLIEPTIGEVTGANHYWRNAACRARIASQPAPTQSK
jgi:hypothetical protein